MKRIVRRDFVKGVLCVLVCVLWVESHLMQTDPVGQYVTLSVAAF